MSEVPLYPAEVTVSHEEGGGFDLNSDFLN